MRMNCAITETESGIFKYYNPLWETKFLGTKEWK